MDQIQSPKILALIVLYGQTLEECFTWRTLHNSENVTWAIYNNGPSPVAFPDSVIFCENLSNGGLSQAYAWGLEIAEQNNCSHVTILDQDTTFPETFFKIVQNAIIHTDSSCFLPTVISKNGFKMSPARWCCKQGREFKNDRIPQKYTFIGSGTTLSTALFRTIWDDSFMNLFLDQIDHYMAYKMRQINVVPALLPATLIQDYAAESTNRESVRARHAIWKKDLRTFGKLIHSELTMELWILYITIKRIVKFRDPFLFR